MHPLWGNSIFPSRCPSQVTGIDRSPMRVEHEYCQSDLQSDLPVQLGVGGLIDLSHPAFADEGRHVVVAESGTVASGQTAPTTLGWKAALPRVAGVALAVITGLAV